MTISVIDNKEKAKELQQKIAENGGYCLCALQHIPETKCMCKAFLEQDHSGPCGCGLYFKNIDDKKA